MYFFLIWDFLWYIIWGKKYKISPQLASNRVRLSSHLALGFFLMLGSPRWQGNIQHFSFHSAACIVFNNMGHGYWKQHIQCDCAVMPGERLSSVPTWNIYSHFPLVPYNWALATRPGTVEDMFTTVNSLDLIYTSNNNEQHNNLGCMLCHLKDTAIYSSFDALCSG